MIVAGIGCKRGTPSAEIVALVRVALATFGIAGPDLAALATEADKAGEPGIAEAARTLALPLLRCTLQQLAQVEARLVTRSPRVLAAKGVTSIAEASALAAAGGNARLLGARLAAGGVTCAIATGEGS